MPTVHREHGLRFIIYTQDHPPPHVHVWGRGVAKIAIQPPALLRNGGLPAKDVKRALGVVEREAAAMLAAWTRLHG